jgi:hypothetical protein
MILWAICVSSDEFIWLDWEKEIEKLTWGFVGWASKNKLRKLR